MVYGNVPNKNYSPKFFSHTHTHPPQSTLFTDLVLQGSIHHFTNSIYRILRVETTYRIYCSQSHKSWNSHWSQWRPNMFVCKFPWKNTSKDRLLLRYLNTALTSWKKICFFWVLPSFLTQILIENLYYLSSFKKDTWVQLRFSRDHQWKR